MTKILIVLISISITMFVFAGLNFIGFVTDPSKYFNLALFFFGIIVGIYGVIIAIKEVHFQAYLQEIKDKCQREQQEFEDMIRTMQPGASKNEAIN